MGTVVTVDVGDDASSFFFFFFFFFETSFTVGDNVLLLGETGFDFLLDELLSLPSEEDERRLSARLEHEDDSAFFDEVLRPEEEDLVPSDNLRPVDSLCLFATRLLFEDNDERD